MPMYAWTGRLRPPKRRSSPKTSYSESGGASSRARAVRTAAGTVSSMSSSSDAARTTRNMSARSAGRGPMWRSANSSCVAAIGWLLVLVLLQKCLVGGGIHQLRQLVWIAGLDLNHPTAVVGVLVHVLGRILQRGVDLHDFARNRSQKIRYGLQRFHRTDRLVLLEHFTFARQIDLRDVAKLVHGELGDAHGHQVVFGTGPFVVFRE